MTSQGSLHGQFQRAVERGNVLQAVALGHELGRLSLSDSFALLLLFAEQDGERFERAAPRWHARLVLAARDVTLGEAQATLAALALLRGPHRQHALEFLARICREHGARLETTSRRFVDEKGGNASADRVAGTRQESKRGAMGVFRTSCATVVCRGARIEARCFSC